MNFDSLKNWIPAFQRANRAEKAMLLFALVAAAPGFYGAFSIDWFQDNKTVRILLAAVCTGLLLYAAYRIWRAPVVTPPPPPLKRPGKGGEKYTINDGKLFLRLGRGDELGRLWRLISDGRVSLAAVQGESGSGKSSLLEGGLRFLLSQDGIEHLDNPKPTVPIPCVYCEMRSRDPAGDLLREIAAALKSEITAKPVPAPATLTKAAKRLLETGKRWIILLDQFEQVSLDEPRLSPVFDFLRTLAHQPSQIRLTAIVAYRMEYASEWNRFCASLDEQNLPAPKLLPLELFKVDGPEGRRAKDILAILGESAGMKLDDVADPLINLLANKDGKVLPFDLSLSLPCLAALRREVPGPNDLPAGGFSAMIARYLRSRLDQTNLRPTDQEAVFATIHLKLTRNSPEGRQRVSDGLTLEELAQDGSIARSDLLAALNLLVDRETSLLEEVVSGDGPKRYRLLHERFIPALEQLAGPALVGVQQARRVFHDCWGAYDPVKPKARLLRSSDLSLVQRHWQQMPDLHSDDAKRDYYTASLRYRARSRLVTVTVGLVALLLIAVRLGQAWHVDRDKQVRHAGQVLNSLALTFKARDLLPESASKLSELAKCNQHGRLKALSEVLNDPVLATNFHRHPGLLAHAVVGLDPSGETTRRTIALVQAALTNAQDVILSARLLAQLRPPPEQAKLLATALVSRMTNATDWLDSDELAALGQALGPLATNLTAEQVRSAADILLIRMTSAEDRRAISELIALGRALGPLATNLSPQQVQLATARLVSRMTNAVGELAWAEINVLRQAVAPLAMWLSTNQVQTLGEALVSQMGSPPSKLDSEGVAILGETLGLLAARLPQEQADPAAALLVSRIIEENHFLLAPSRIEELTEALRPLTANLSEDQAQALAGKLLSRMTDGAKILDSKIISALGDALWPFSEKLDAGQVQSTAALLVNRMTNGVGGQAISETIALGKALGPLATKLRPEQVQPAVAVLVSRMTNSPSNSAIYPILAFYPNFELGRALRPLARHLSREQAKPLAEELLSRLTNATHAMGIAALGLGLEPMANTLEESDSARALQLLESAMHNGSANWMRDILTGAWIALEKSAYQQDGATQRVERIISWLDQPHFARARDSHDDNFAEDPLDAQTQLLRHVGEITGQNFKDDLWNFVAWAKASDGGVKFGVRLPDRPKWWLFKPKHDPHPSFSSSKINP